MLPWLHDADTACCAWHTTLDRPSTIEIFLIASPAMNPIHWLSGEKNGSRTSSASPTICSDSAFSFLSTRRDAWPAAAGDVGDHRPVGRDRDLILRSGKSIPGGSSNDRRA
jgi:hypothetical protein